MDAYKKSMIELEREMYRQIDLNYGAFCIALHEMGWGQRKIAATLERTYAYWETCADNNDISMLEMLENETGIEIRNSENGKSWHDLPYLNGQLKCDANKLNKAQWIYMRQRQREWIGPQIVACFLYTMHRRHAWGVNRLNKLVEAGEEIKNRYNYNAKETRAACLELTKISLIREGG